MDEDPGFLTIREFALRLKVTARRARALVAAGRVEGAVKIGRDWLIPTAMRIAPGTRGPRSRAIGQGSRLVLAKRGQGQALKRRRQTRFRKVAAQSPDAARAASALRLPRGALRFEEPELTLDDLG